MYDLTVYIVHFTLHILHFTLQCTMYMYMYIIIGKGSGNEWRIGKMI